MTFFSGTNLNGIKAQIRDSLGEDDFQLYVKTKAEDYLKRSKDRFSFYGVDDFTDLLAALDYSVAHTRPDDLRTKRKHLSWFHDGEIGGPFSSADDRSHLVIQGAGDLSMNPKNVAFVSRQDGGDLIVPLGETLIDQSYSCLLGFKRERDLPEEILSAISKITDSVGGLIGNEIAIASVMLLPRQPFVRLEGEGSRADLSDALEFALYGKRIIWDGKILPREVVIDEFRDLRHVFRLVNINPAAERHETWTKQRLNEFCEKHHCCPVN
jgi:hypothetical protein